MDASIIIPVHNRRDTTARCLQNLESDGVFEWAEIIVIDDGSTDGTAEFIRQFCPAVGIFSGDGNLWWAGAIALGMKSANPATQTLVWLNDDCRPRTGILRRLVEESVQSHSIVAAQALTEEGHLYGGHRKTWFGLKSVPAPDGTILSVDTFGGNCVAIPRSIAEAVGPVDFASMPQYLADADFGLRVKEAGFSNLIAGWAWCDNDHNRHPALESWTDHNSFPEIFRSMRTPKSAMYWPGLRAFYTKHWGIWGYGLAAIPYVRFYMMWGVAAFFGRGVLLQLRKLSRKLS